MLLTFEFFSSKSMYLLGLVTCLIIYPIIFKKNNVKIIDGILLTLLQIVFAYLFAILFASFEAQKLKYVGVSYYGTIFSLFLIPFLYSIIRRLDYNKILDLIAPIHMLMLFFMKLGCYIEGCCYGITINGFLVPIQLIEAIVALFIYLSIYVLNNKIKGFVYQYILIIYGSCRFIIEFFRYHDKLILGFLSNGQLWSIFAILLGIILYIYKKRSLIKKQ